MKSWHRDYESHFHMLDRFLDLADLTSVEASVIKKELARYMNVRLQRGFWMHPEITRFHTEWYREFYRITAVQDPFRSMKQKSNELARQIINDLRIKDFRDAIIASIIANKLDFGMRDYDNKRMPISIEDFQNIRSTNFLYDDYSYLTSSLAHARLVLYLVDNNGEILFDRIVIENIRSMNPYCSIYVAGKSSPMLNDVTYDELLSLGFHNVCEVISTGSNCFGVPEDETSDEFKDVMAQADLIVAKGQSYLEFWLEYNVPNLFNLAFTKFPIMDPVLGEIQPEKNIILRSQRYCDDDKKSIDLLIKGAPSRK